MEWHKKNNNNGAKCLMLAAVITKENITGKKFLSEGSDNTGFRWLLENSDKVFEFFRCKDEIYLKFEFG